MDDDLANSGNQTVPGVDTTNTVTVEEVHDSAATENFFERVFDAVKEFVEEIKEELTGDDDGEKTKTDAETSTVETNADDGTNKV